jgi:phosphoadenosine phosphosulfate reductase
MDDLLPGFEPSEADLIQQALDMPFERKVEKAILFFQTYCDGAYGAFSGGKDSCVIKGLAVEAGVNVDWHYNNTTIDPPELVQFIRKVHPDVKWNNPKIGLLKQMEIQQAPPTRVMRWCCKEYKEGAGADRPRIIGVRISESASRAKRWSLVTPDRITKQHIFCPICYWTDEDVWQYIRSRNLPYCKLYDEGFTRLGCIGCPLNRDRQTGFDRWPRYEKAWRRAFQRTWDKWHNVLTNRGKVRSFTKCGSAEKWFEWWMSNEAYNGKDDQCIFEDMMEQR